MKQPNLSIEATCKGTVAGIDEVGRGPWAGPVVAAAVVLDTKRVPDGINDSKKLKLTQREEVYLRIVATCKTGIGIATVEEIDRLNVLAASQLAMHRAFERLGMMPDFALVDGNRAPQLPCQTKTVIGGDAISLSIAAASIIAKVARDRLMREMSIEFPVYGWEHNAGYGTKHHQQALISHGVSPYHRRSFAPIRSLLEGRGLFDYVND
jgi:ribonuclease HII